MVQSMVQSGGIPPRLELSNTEWLKKTWVNVMGSEERGQDVFIDWFTKAQSFYPEIYGVDDGNQIPSSIASSLYPEILCFGPKAPAVIEALQFVLNLDYYVKCHPKSQQYLIEVFTDFQNSLKSYETFKAFTDAYKSQNQPELLKLIDMFSYVMARKEISKLDASTIRLSTTTVAIALAFALNLDTQNDPQNAKTVSNFNKAWKILRQKLGTVSSETQMPHFTI